MSANGYKETFRSVSAVLILAAVSIFVSACSNSGANNSGGMASDRRESANSYDTEARANTSLPNINSGANDSANSTRAPGDFWTKAAASGMAEVAMGKLASSKAVNAEVKKFGQMMVNDHTKANNELKALADKKGVNLPTAPDPLHQKNMDELGAMSGAEFDREYVRMQIMDHEAAVDLFESQAESDADAEAKQFAAKNLPVLRQHLEMIRKIQASLEQ